MAREIVLDTETTGFEPTAGHRLVEIACLEIEDFIPTGRSFHVYIDPCRDVPVDAERVHGLSTAFLTGKPRFEHPDVPTPRSSPTTPASTAPSSTTSSAS